MLPGASWCLDTFLRHGEASLTLIERAAAHPSGHWHSAALSFDGQTMAHYVDGVARGVGCRAIQAPCVRTHVDRVRQNACRGSRVGFA